MGNHNQQGHVHEGEPYPYDLPHNPASQALRDEAAHYMELAGRFTDWLFDQATRTPSKRPPCANG